MFNNLTKKEETGHSKASDVAPITRISLFAELKSKHKEIAADVEDDEVFEWINDFDFTKNLTVSSPVAEQKQTEKRASGNGKRNPEMIERKIDPGIANVWNGFYFFQKINTLELASLIRRCFAHWIY